MNLNSYRVIPQYHSLKEFYSSTVVGGPYFNILPKNDAFKAFDNKKGTLLLCGDVVLLDLNLSGDWQIRLLDDVFICSYCGPRSFDIDKQLNKLMALLAVFDCSKSIYKASKNVIECPLNCVQTFVPDSNEQPQQDQELSNTPKAGAVYADLSKIMPSPSYGTYILEPIAVGTFEIKSDINDLDFLGNKCHIELDAKDGLKIKATSLKDLPAPLWSVHKDDLTYRFTFAGANNMHTNHILSLIDAVLKIKAHTPITGYINQRANEFNLLLLGND